MKSYSNHKNTAKEKNKRYILHWLPAHKRSKGKRYVLKCVDKNSWEYWEYTCSDGHPGRWPATGPAIIGVFMIWLLYRLILDILSRLKEIFSPLAAKIINNKKFLQGDARKAQSAKRIIQLTLCAKRHAPCAFPLATGGKYE